jgi:phenylalanyl-tRNA synthetase beta chain
MKISLNWLKEYVDFDLPVRELTSRLTMIGLVCESWEEKESDIVLDVETYPNRPDTLGHLGIAREVAAMLRRPLKERSWPLAELTVKTSELVDVQILDEDLCSRYCGMVVKGIEIRPSPDWLRSRIAAMGLHSINNVVDMTNFVLFATGQPIHAFDLAKLEGPRIIVRRAKKGETIVTLEGKDVALQTEMLVIADEKKPVAIAGVIGGQETGITDATSDVFIESAYFDPVSVRKTRKSLEIQTDACYRFERGADISFAPEAALMAASILTQFGGKAARDVIDRYPKPRKMRELLLRSRRIAGLLGVDVDDEFVEKTLGDLGFGVKANQRGAWRVQVPFFRVDIEREADLIEEIARFYGYDRIPAVVPPLEVLEPIPSNKDKILKLSDQLFHYGFDEVINQSFADPEKEPVFQSGRNPVPIRNPISIKASILRTSLLGGLLENAAHNINRGVEGVHIFEIGNVYSWDDKSATEGLHLGLASTGPIGRLQWEAKPVVADFFHLKGACEAFMEALRYVPFSFEEASHPFFYEDASLALIYKGEQVGRLGRVHKRLIDLYSLGNPVFAAEIDLALLFGKQPRPFEYSPLPKFPAVTRDLSFLVGRSVSYNDVKLAVEKAGAAYLEGFDIIDQYSGESIPGDAKSLLLRFTYRNPKATLTADEVDKSEKRVVKQLTAVLNIQLREGGGSK